MAQTSSKEHVHDVFESVAGQYDAANDRISLGMHHMWKSALMDAVMSATSSIDSNDPPMVLDVCCGTGDIVELIATCNPGALVVGLDFSAGMLSVAERRLENLDNTMLFEGNAMQLPFDDNTFDAATISFGLRNTPDYARVVNEMARVVRPGGKVACLDASVPDNPFVLPFYQFYYKNIMTLLGGGVSKHSEYEWLYQSTQEFLSKRELAQLFVDAGLVNVTYRPFMMGSAALHVGTVDRFSAE